MSVIGAKGEVAKVLRPAAARRQSPVNSPPSESKIPPPAWVATELRDSKKA